jgi:glycosyltransferase involved in cell wall biosynthesis
VRILVLTDRYWPEISAPSFRLHGHARVWVADGHDVTVVTTVPNAPRGVPYAGYRNRPWQTEHHDGVRIVRLGSYMARNQGVLRRSLDYGSFAAAAVASAPALPPFDVLLASSPPFTVAAAGDAISSLRRRPWVFEVRDLWPASIRAVGLMRGPVRGRVVDALERWELALYRRAARVLVVTHSFREDLVGRGVPADHVDVVTNGVDPDVFDRGRVDGDARDALDLPRDAFVVGYVGTVGMAHGLATLLDAADRLRHRTDIHWLVVGEGADRAQLEASAAARGLSAVHFRDFVPHDRVPSVLAALDLALIHLRPEPLFRTVIPSKIFEAMAMGVPLLVALEGETGDIVRRGDAGTVITPGDAVALADAVVALAADPETRLRQGANGARLVREVYGRKPLARAALATLQHAADRRR